MNFIKLNSIISLFFCSLVASVFCQTNVTDNKNSIIEQRIEIIAESREDEDLDYTVIYEHLQDIFDSPLNLNKATKQELQSIFILTDMQVNSFIAYREKYGLLISIYELVAIKGFSKEVIDNILPFVTLNEQSAKPFKSIDELINRGKSELFLRWQSVLEEPKGYSPIDPELLAESPNSRYLGSKDKLYMRFRYKFKNNLSFGFTGEKDPGEEFFKGAQKNGFDYYSAHIFLRDYGKIKALALGDFQAQFGQGLTFWSGLSYSGKSSNVMKIKQSPMYLRPYTSVTETDFLRGAGINANLGPIDITAFASRRKIDGNIVTIKDSIDDVLDEEIVFSSIQASGFHRTLGELEDKNSVLEENFGGNLTYRYHNLKVGATAAYSEFNANYNRQLFLYNQYTFISNTNLMMGMDYEWSIKNFDFFGEVARSKNGGVGFVNGMLVEIDPRLKLSVLYRNFQRDFQSLNSAGAFSESTDPNNESGIFTGIQFQPLNKLSLNIYYDQFKFPWLKFQVNAPSGGYDFLAQADYKMSRKISMYFRYRHREKQINTPEEIDEIDFLVGKTQENYRYNVTIQISDDFRLRNRVEFTNYKLKPQEAERGFMIYQDLIYNPSKKPYSLSVRYAIFDTDTYNARMYAYENDILYVFSVPSYAGRGVRFYFNANYKISSNLEAWFRIGQFYYDDRDVISSGTEEINGRTKTEVKAQLRFRF
jgi:Helix-hairpin-helix motif